MIYRIRYFLFLICFSLYAQYYWEFGQNKIQYREFDWQVIEGEHFEIIYYSGGERIAKIAISILEPAYDSLKSLFNRAPNFKIPIIIYNSQNEFEQTNVTLELIDERTGGFTEIFKNRVVVPFTGNLYQFYHVLRHELMHVFQYDIMKGGVRGFIFSGLHERPLWVIEGMAEYFSINWDNEADMVIRDAVYFNKIVPIYKLHEIEGSYLMYKEGQSIMKFIADKYGREKISEIFLRSKSNFDNALEKVLGMNKEKLDEEWQTYLKKKYWKICAEKEIEPQEASKLTTHKDYVFNVAPNISPDGLKIAFLSDRDGYDGLYLMSSIDGKIISKIVSGGKSAGFESLHILHGGIDWFPDNKVIVFVSKVHEKDVLYIMDVKKKKIIKKFTTDAEKIFSPSVSPSGRFIAFRGLKLCQADIYILDIKTEKTMQLTDDIYDDITPDWIDENNIIFSSDRNENLHYGYYSLFKINIETRKIEKIFKERATYLASPIYFNDKILFVGNFNGINNLYCFFNDSIYQITDVLGGVFTPSLSLDGNFLAISIFQNQGWDIYVLKNPLNKIKEKISSVEEKRYLASINDTGNYESKKLGIRLTPDWGGQALGYVSNYGAAFYIRFSISDLVGDHNIFIESYTPQNLLANYNLTYFYLPKRIDFGANIFKEENYYYLYTFNNREYHLHEKYQGGGIELIFPIDKFHRFELPIFLYYYLQEIVEINEQPYVVDEEKFWLSPVALSFIKDNSLWGHTGPNNGERYKLSFLRLLPIFSPTLDINFYKIDYRKYIRINKDVSFGFRFINMKLYGPDEDKIMPPRIGGSEGMRGYSIDSVSGKNIFMTNLELRYLFIRKIDFAFPISFSIKGIRGAIFCDMGIAKDILKDIRIFKGARLEDLKLDFGIGLRLRFPYFVLKFDIAKNTDLIKISDKTYYNISLWPEF